MVAFSLSLVVRLGQWCIVIGKHRSMANSDRLGWDTVKQ